MMHGPCGADNPESPCMVNGVCSKSFPKPFSDSTMLTDSYPIYQRRDNGRSVVVKGKMLDNRFVVPYNPYLLLKFGAHINVEAISGVGYLKYMHKYVHKGYDAAEVSVTNDEIQTFLNCRYVSAPEAAFRLCEFPMHKKSHKVMRLSIHLPNKQSVYFKKGDEAAAVTRALNKDTHLTAWFKVNLLLRSASQKVPLL